MKLTTYLALFLAGGLIFLLGVLFGRIGILPTDSGQLSHSVSQTADALSTSQGTKTNQIELLSDPEQESSFKFSELIVSLEDFPPGPQREIYQQAVIRDWAKGDPARALAYAQSLSPTNEEYLASVFEGWAVNNPDNAWATALNMGPYAIEAVIDTVGKSAPEKLEGFLADLDLNVDKPAREIFIKGIRSMIANGLTEGAIQAADKVQEPEYRRESFKTILLGLFEEEISQDIATEVLLSFPTEQDRVFAANAASRMMALEAPDGATSWAASLPEGTPSRQQALFQSATKWFQRDFHTAMDWLNDNAMDPDLDKVIAYVALNEKLVYHTPDISMEWVESIHDANIRFEGIVHVAATWAETDPNRAFQHLDESEFLSPSQKESARREVQEILDAP